ncbi:hypothetical protein SUGI_0561140 [Cryptomeria japonica]|nr:hypothetical protein SUGI_0561140 [Cryptomeria japonica]
MDPMLSQVEINPNAPSHLVAINWIDAIRSANYVPPQSHDMGFKEVLILHHLTVDHVDIGLILSTLAVKPPIMNRYNTLHGGVVASIESIMGLVAVKTVAADKVCWQTKMSMSYLSAGCIRK